MFDTKLGVPSNPEFSVYKLNDDGAKKANTVAYIFDMALNELKQICPESREFSIVKTKMEEASFFAKKAMAKDPANQQPTESVAAYPLAREGENHGKY